MQVTRVTRGHMEADIEGVEGNVKTVARLACQEMAHDLRLFAVMRLWRVSWERAQRTARAAGFLKAQCDLEQVCMRGSERAIRLLSCHNSMRVNHIVGYARACLTILFNHGYMSVRVQYVTCSHSQFLRTRMHHTRTHTLKEAQT